MKVIPVGNDYALAMRLRSVQATTKENKAPIVPETKVEAKTDAKSEYTTADVAPSTANTEAAPVTTAEGSQIKKTGKKKKEATEETEEN